MKVLIIEDEAPAFRRLQKQLEKLCPEVEILEVIDSIEDSVKWLIDNPAPDLIFMDIQLSDGLSFDIFEKVEISKPVIFTTAFDDYMLRAFKVNSIDYLLKPISEEDLHRSLTKYAQLKNGFTAPTGAELGTLIKSIRLDDRSFKNRFLVKMGEKLLSVEACQIAYFQTKNGIVYLVTNEGKKYLMDLTLDDLCKQLEPEKFFRANRQFIISYASIKEVSRYHKGKLEVKIDPVPSENVLVSTEKATSFKEWFG